MEQVVIPEPLARALDRVLDSLIRDEAQLWELPPPLAALYYLGHANAAASMTADLIQARADRDRYYRAAARGGFAAPVQVTGRTYAELCLARGQFDLAQRVAADMAAIQFKVSTN